RVKTPNIAKEKMYLTSGHLPHLYADSMFPPMELVEDSLLKKEGGERINAEMKQQLQKTLTQLNQKTPGLDESLAEEGATRETLVEDILKLAEQPRNVERYYLRAMNCPHHHRIFGAEPRSYRDLP